MKTAADHDKHEPEVTERGTKTKKTTDKPN